MQRTITFPDIGTVQISKKSNARKLKIRIHPEKGVLVTIPKRSSFKEGEKFVQKNSDWVLEKLHQLQQKSEDVLFTPEKVFVTRISKLEYEVDARVNLKAVLRGNTLKIIYNPLLVDFENSEIQDFIKKNILRLLTKESKIYLTERYIHLSDKFNLHATKLSFGKAATRWGTCNSRDEIRLSSRLLLLPNHLIDYVITHELCHLRYKNHGADFHNLLNQLSENKSKDLNKELRTYSIHLKPGDYSFGV